MATGQTHGGKGSTARILMVIWWEIKGMGDDE